VFDKAKAKKSNNNDNVCGYANNYDAANVANACFCGVSTAVYVTAAARAACGNEPRVTARKRAAGNRFFGGY